MINSIIQSIIENKDFLEKSLENSIKNNEISIFSRDLRKVFDEAGRKTIVGILEMVDTLLFEDTRRKAIRALSETSIKGVKTNIAFLLNVLNNPTFAQGMCDTGFIANTPELLNIDKVQDT